MAAAPARDIQPRWHRVFSSADSFTDDLGDLGLWVGPRQGPDRRTQGQIEDYVLRRLLVAWTMASRLRFPFEIWSTETQVGWPDFVLEDDWGRLGLEVTTAGETGYQRWLSQTDDHDHPDDALMYDSDGVAHVASVVDAFGGILTKKAADVQKYLQNTPVVDLAIYEMTASGDAIPGSEKISAVRNNLSQPAGYQQVHIVMEPTIYLDVFGAKPLQISIANAYEIDYAAWIQSQVEKLRTQADHRANDWEYRLDFKHIAEELDDLGKSEKRALLSQLQRLLMHLLKYACQPGKRGPSWENSIRLARIEILERTLESPSLRPVLRRELDKVYEKARLEAAAETGLSVATFPDACPYSVEQLLDRDFLPDAATDEEDHQ